MLVNSVRGFHAKGYDVEILMDKGMFDLARIDFRASGVSVRTFDVPVRRVSHLRDRFLRLLLRVFTKFPKSVHLVPLDLLRCFHFPDFVFMRNELAAYLESARPDFIIAADIKSICCLPEMKTKCPVLYYNLELYDWKGSDLPLKRLEHSELKKVSAVVTTSRARKDIYCSINKFPPDRVFTLPVASAGDSVKVRGSYFRDKFSIPSGKRIVLYAGNLHDTFMVLQIVESVRDWPDGFVLVVHTWQNWPGRWEYWDRLAAAAKGLPVHLSSGYISPEEFPSALSSADIGLCFYDRSLDVNFRELLFSSNKISEYLKAGLPVVTSPDDDFQDFFGRTGAGLATGIGGLPKALSAIGGDLEGYREKALNAYETEMRFEPYFERFYNEIQTFLK